MNGRISGLTTGASSFYEVSYAAVTKLYIPRLSKETRVQRLTQPQSQHLDDSGQSLSCEHDCSVISTGHLFGSVTNGHTPG